MSSRLHDIIIAGGSVAGASLAWALCKHGMRVLLLEPELQFRDRVRGESIHPWGVAEAERLNLLPALQAARARDVRYWDTYVAGERLMRRDLAATTPGSHSGLTVHHPELQEALLSAAAQAGCEVRRGARVIEVQPGEAPYVLSSDPTGTEHAHARLVVLADGRSSALRAQLGLITRGDRSGVCVSGVLLESTCAEDAVGTFYPPVLGSMALLAPLRADRTRVYLVQQTAATRERYSGPARVDALLSHCRQLGVPEPFTSSARALGPLGTFDTTLSELDPASLPPGVVAVGDAAGPVDPAFGCGMSMALRDARTLRDLLLIQPDLQRAAAQFARERAAYHGALLRIEGWLRRILYRCGTDSPGVLDAAMIRLDALRVDLIGLGPDARSDVQTEAQLFADP